MEIEQKLRNHIDTLKTRKKELIDEVHQCSLKGQWITANQCDTKMRVIDYEIKELTNLL